MYKNIDSIIIGLLTCLGILVFSLGIGLINIIFHSPSAVDVLISLILLPVLGFCLYAIKEIVLTVRSG